MSESVFAADLVFEGRVTGHSVRVLGAFSGELVLEGDLAIGEAAQVAGTVTARSVTISGGFEGEIRAQRIAFGGSARARGRFFAPVLGLYEGAAVQGTFNIEAQDGAEIAPGAEGAVQMEVAGAAGAPAPELPAAAGLPPNGAVPERASPGTPEPLEGPPTPGSRQPELATGEPRVSGYRDTASGILDSESATPSHEIRDEDSVLS